MPLYLLSLYSMATSLRLEREAEQVCQPHCSGEVPSNRDRRSKAHRLL